MVDNYDDIEILDFDDDIEILDFDDDLIDTEEINGKQGFIHTLLSAFFVGFTVGVGITVLFYIFHLIF